MVVICLRKDQAVAAMRLLRTAGAAMRLLQDSSGSNEVTADSSGSNEVTADSSGSNEFTADSRGQPPQTRTKRVFRELQNLSHNLCVDIATGNYNSEDFLEVVAQCIQFSMHSSQ